MSLYVHRHAHAQTHTKYLPLQLIQRALWEVLDSRESRGMLIHTMDADAPHSWSQCWPVFCTGETRALLASCPSSSCCDCLHRHKAAFTGVFSPRTRTCFILHFCLHFLQASNSAKWVENNTVQVVPYTCLAPK